MDTIIHKMTLVNCNGRPVDKKTMFTNQEMSTLKLCVEDQTLEDFDREMLTSVMYKIARLYSDPKPEIIVTIEDGCYYSSHANTEVVLIIEDKDSIKDGGDLFYAAPIFEDYDAALRKAKVNAKHPRELRIFVHDPEDEFPYQVMIDGEIMDTFKDLKEAAAFMQGFVEASNVIS
jgi:hypothetical protein